MKNLPLPRLDQSSDIYQRLLPHCRLGPGEIWTDPNGRHRVGCLDAADGAHISELMASRKATLAIHDPPYNLAAFAKRTPIEFIHWSRAWIENTTAALTDNAALYVWLGADQNEGFQPLPEFMLMMRDQPYRSRSFITMRNQRGYGTQKNWMAVRQELLYYTKGEPPFHVDHVYTAIPKILRGYYKKVGDVVSENLQRSRSDTIRAGNVWVDIQQVFYRMEENVSGCYAQKPLKSVDRIIRTSSNEGDLVVDFFSHSGATLLAAELAGRDCHACDLDPVFAEISIRRLERYRESGKTGWQNGHAFEEEISL